MDDKNYDNNMSLVFSELNHMPCDRAYCSQIFSIRFNAKRIYTNDVTGIETETVDNIVHVTTDAESE